MNSYTIAGFWLVRKMRQRSRESGFFVAAQQMRKQGYPLWMARLVLLGVV